MAQFQVIFMDAGQGDSTLVVYPDNSLMLVDCGSIKNGKVVSSEIRAVLNRYAPANGNVINTLILSHPDEDHYNLVPQFFTSKHPLFGVNRVYYGGDIKLYKNKKEKNATYEWLKNHPNAGAPPNIFGGRKPNKYLSRAGVSVYILAANATGNPKKPTSGGKNANSIALLIEYRGVKIFLMADASIYTEGFILDSVRINKLPNLLPNTGGSVLKMGHHGSATSSGDSWVKAIVPNGLFISSDTRIFSGRGLPSSSHLNKVVNLSKIKTLPASHTYVYFNPKKKSFATNTTNKVICTTLFKIKYLSKRLYKGYGGSWYYTITNKGVFVTSTDS